MLIEKLQNLPVFLTVLLGFLIIASASGVATLTINTTDTLVDFSAENFVLDLDTSVGNTIITKASSDQAANGNESTSPVDATVGLVTLNTALTQDDFVYEFEVTEKLADSWDDARQYNIEVFGDGQPIGTLYLDNNNDNNGEIEGAIV
jgi:hypothetical protein